MNKDIIGESNMNDPIFDLGNQICETLTFCYSSAHKKSLQAEARKMDASLEQIVAAAIAQRISEKFVVQHRLSPNPQDN